MDEVVKSVYGKSNVDEMTLREMARVAKLAGEAGITLRELMIAIHLPIYGVEKKCPLNRSE